MSLLGVLGIAGSGMSAESERLSTVASNIANANSSVGPGGQPYRAREVVFQAVSADGAGRETPSPGMAGVKVAGIVESDAPLKSVYDPGSSFADANGYVQMPNVNPVDEMVNMLSAQQDYQADLEAFNVAKTLALRTLQI
ncbi:MAG TPA: flagellar basal body rod protein FlgC [Stellaceae bacterium]|jgi:flagellar basal-body rod protein FlgC|nr:flagellar basal body rod protein FlgC [Stellaceae bacterium]